MTRWVFVTCLLVISTDNTKASPFEEGEARPILGSRTAGVPLPGLTAVERELFRKGRDLFEVRNSVQGDTIVASTESGLGPRFNLDSCGGCHAHPATGGSSPRINPQIAAAKREGARNSIPPFIQLDGPALQVRRRSHRDGRPDQSVKALYTISGRRDAGTCELPQWDFSEDLSRNNLAFRMPTPVFGAGLIEAISETSIVEQLAVASERKRKLGIQGRPNRDPRDGAVTRFGWKAQTRSLDLFAAEAYVMEQGVTNEFFPDEIGNPPAVCKLNPTPEDRKAINVRRTADAHSSVTLLAQFMRFLAPLTSRPDTPEVNRGRAVFDSIGCNLCHTPELRTERSSSPVLSEKIVPLFSDLLLHRMGSMLADGIQLSQAGEDEFRTAPLWGAGQRLFFMHDGRARNLVDAILLHSDANYKGKRKHPPSEANRVTELYKNASASDQSALIAFLQSL